MDPLTPKFKALSECPARLVLYTAPTGTGKTLTPLGLSSGYRVIFICAARHVGLALAKSAVCMGKRIGIAFGCETPDDIVFIILRHLNILEIAGRVELVR